MKQGDTRGYRSTEYEGGRGVEWEAWLNGRPNSRENNSSSMNLIGKIHSNHCSPRKRLNQDLESGHLVSTIRKQLRTGRSSYLEQS